MNPSIEDLMYSKVIDHMQLYNSSPSQIILSREAHDKLIEGVLAKYNKMAPWGLCQSYMGIPVSIWDVEDIQVGVRD